MIPNLFLVVFCGVFGLNIGAPQTGLQIVNGTDAKEGEFKFAVSIRSNGRHECGGSIIDGRHILTAAHCLCDDKARPKNPKEFSIQYGSVKITRTYERSVNVSEIICNKFRFTDLTVMDDIAVAKLGSDIPDDGTWEVAKLSKSFDTSKDSKGIIIGWGLLWDGGPISNTLQKLYVDIYNDTVCQTYGKEQHICIGAPVGSSCQSDSGSPLTTFDNEQIGVLSFGMAPCGIANRKDPNAYSKVAYFYQWIEENSRI